MVNFDGVNKTITVTNTLIEVRRDLYSAWKRWAVVGDNLKYLQAFRSVGGDGIGGGSSSPNFFFLMNNWKIVVDGVVAEFKYNLYCEESSNETYTPFVYVNGGNATNSVSSSPVVTVVEDSGSGLTASQTAELKSIYLSLVGDRTQDLETGRVIVFEEDGVTARHEIQAYKDGAESTLANANELRSV